MPIDQTLASFFGSQERRKGTELARKDLVVISSASDADVRAFVKGSIASRVSLQADDVAAASFTGDCSCPQARKGTLCKHIWAVLLKLEDTGSDFLEGKTEIAKASAGPTSSQQPKKDDFKKQLYQKQKARDKETRKNKKQTESGPRFSYPEPVQEALTYFKDNGVPLEPLELEELINARKLLSRVFHPDKGGTHAEVITLNLNFEIIQDYLKS